MASSNRQFLGKYKRVKHYHEPCGVGGLLLMLPLFVGCCCTCKTPSVTTGRPVSNNSQSFTAHPYLGPIDLKIQGSMWMDVKKEHINGIYRAEYRGTRFEWSPQEEVLWVNDVSYGRIISGDRVDVVVRPLAVTVNDKLRPAGEARPSTIPAPPATGPAPQAPINEQWWATLIAITNQHGDKVDSATFEKHRSLLPLAPHDEHNPAIKFGRARNLDDREAGVSRHVTELITVRRVEGSEEVILETRISTPEPPEIRKIQYMTFLVGGDGVVTAVVAPVRGNLRQPMSFERLDVGRRDVHESFARVLTYWKDLVPSLTHEFHVNN